MRVSDEVEAGLLTRQPCGFIFSRVQVMAPMLEGEDIQLSFCDAREMWQSKESPPHGACFFLWGPPTWLRFSP